MFRRPNIGAMSRSTRLTYHPNLLRVAGGRRKLPIGKLLVVGDRAAVQWAILVRVHLVFSPIRVLRRRRAEPNRRIGQRTARRLFLERHFFGLPVKQLAEVEALEAQLARGELLAGRIGGGTAVGRAPARRFAAAELIWTQLAHILFLSLGSLLDRLVLGDLARGHVFILRPSRVGRSAGRFLRRRQVTGGRNHQRRPLVIIDGRRGVFSKADALQNPAERAVDEIAFFGVL